MKYDQGRYYRVGTLLLVVILTTVLMTGCVNKAQQNFERPPAPVQIAVSTSQDVPTYLDAIGKTAAREVVSIQPQVSGRITKIHFTDGSNVRRGDMLFTIDPRPFEANLKQAQANL
ncbi:MAG TPA: biotin/lipoyl-binding protein, partial [Pyrinomonadaceae bacterium]|nr:biotin/lipoyl-binding protein [Pyrinomonadaceae bacterium]